MWESQYSSTINGLNSVMINIRSSVTQYTTGEIQTVKAPPINILNQYLHASTLWNLLDSVYCRPETRTVEAFQKCCVSFCVCLSDQDGAEPSANSVSASNLLRLSHYTGRQEWLQRSQQLLAAFSDRLTRVPIALPEMVRALMAQHYTLKQVILTHMLTWIDGYMLV